MSNPGGKGHAPRQQRDDDAFRRNWEAIFGDKLKKDSEELLKETRPAFERSAMRVANTLAGGNPNCQHPETCAEPFCSCEVKDAGRTENDASAS